MKRLILSLLLFVFMALLTADTIEIEDPQEGAQIFYTDGEGGIKVGTVVKPDPGYATKAETNFIIASGLFLIVLLIILQAIQGKRISKLNDHIKENRRYVQDGLGDLTGKSAVFERDINVIEQRLDPNNELYVGKEYHNYLQFVREEMYRLRDCNHDQGTYLFEENSEAAKHYARVVCSGCGKTMRHLTEKEYWREFKAEQMKFADKKLSELEDKERKEKE